MKPPTTDRPTVADVVNKLRTQGSSDQIAVLFEAEQVRGVRKRASLCPVANYIRRETGQDVRAHPLMITVITDGRGKHLRFAPIVSVGPRDPVGQFMARFDEGDYPELVVELTAA